MPHQNARISAYLIEYLVQEARKQQSPPPIKFIVDTYPTNGTMKLSFKAEPKSEGEVKLPDPPAKFRPTNWSEASQHQSNDYEQNDWIHWTWPASATQPDLHSETAANYAVELLRFCPAEIKFMHIEKTTGGDDPISSESTGITRHIDDDTIVVLTERENEPQHEFYSKGSTSRQVRPNVIYPDGVARYGGFIDQNFVLGRRTIGKPEEDQPRSEAKTIFLEARAVFSTPLTKNDIKNPHIDHTPAYMANKCAEAVCQMSDEWKTKMREQGFSVLEDNQAQPNTITKNTIGSPYAERATIISKHPVAFIGSNLKNPIRVSIEHSIAAQTRYTPVHDQTKKASSAFILGIEANIGTAENPQIVKFDSETFFPEVPEDTPRENGIIIRAHSISARVSIIKAGKEIEIIDLDLPILASAANGQKHPNTIFTTNKIGDEKLSEEQVKHFINPIREYSWPPMLMNTMISTIFRGGRHAFIKEIERHINNMSIVSRPPEQKIKLVLDPSTMTLEEATE